MPPTSAGLLMFRRVGTGLQVLLGHPGGSWTVPKGKLEAGEAPLAAACREFHEETGLTAAGPFFSLGSIRQKSGKTVHVWAFAGDADLAACHSNLTRLQWPPKSGKWIDVPELDRYEFFSVDQAREKLNPAQVELLDRLNGLIDAGKGPPTS